MNIIINYRVLSLLLLAVLLQTDGANISLPDWKDLECQVLHYFDRWDMGICVYGGDAFLINIGGDRHYRGNYCDQQSSHSDFFICEGII